jgi:hypothetical protein
MNQEFDEDREMMRKVEQDHLQAIYKRLKDLSDENDRLRAAAAGANAGAEIEHWKAEAKRWEAVAETAWKRLDEEGWQNILEFFAKQDAGADARADETSDEKSANASAT